MLSAQRKTIILERLDTAGQVSVLDLSREWQVSEDTIRRDLRELAAEGLVQRVHGGALRRSTALGNYESRETLSTGIKLELGRLALGLLGRGQVAAIDGGTTNLQLVRSIPKDFRCTIVTHSPIIASELRHHSGIEVILIGGRIFRHSQVAVGTEVGEAIGRLRLDSFFLGATGIHPELGATTGDWEEAAVKRAFCRAAAEVVLIASAEKIGAAAPYQIVGASEISALVAEEADGLEPFRRLGIEILHPENPLGRKNLSAPGEF